MIWYFDMNTLGSLVIYFAEVGIIWQCHILYQTKVEQPLRGGVKMQFIAVPTLFYQKFLPILDGVPGGGTHIFFRTGICP